MSVLFFLVILVFCCSESVACNIRLRPKPVYVTIMYRHGARTPFHFYPNDPHQNLFATLGKGELTDIGKTQHYNLGKYLLTLYKDLLTDPEKVYVQSTKVNRVIESAECNLAAMFPQHGEYFTDTGNGVHCSTRVDYEFSKLLRDNDRCPAYIRHIKGVVMPAVAEQLEKTGNEAVVETLYKYTGLEKIGLVEEYRVFDTLHIEEKDYNLPLDEWTKQVYPSPLQDIVITKFRTKTWDDKAKLLKTGPLLKEIVSNMENKIKGQNSFNANIYAAHDVNIIQLLDTLGVYDGKHLPGYASCIMLELWEDGHGQHYVKLYYKKSFEDERKELHLLKSKKPLLLRLFTRRLYFADFLQQYRKYIPENLEELCR